MNKKLKPFCILIDSSFFNNNQFINKKDSLLIYLIYNSIIINEHAYLETCENIKKIQLAKMLEDPSNNISTSQPNPELIKEKIQFLSKQYQKIFIFTMPKKLSNETNQINRMFAEHKYPNIYVYNQFLGVYLSSQIIVNQAIKILNTNSEIQPEILFRKLRNIEEQMLLFLIPGNINRVKKSGRGSKIIEIINSFLRLKILLKWNGKLSVVTASRTFKKLFKKIQQKLSHLDKDFNFQLYIIFSRFNKYKEIILKESNIFLKKIIIEKMPSTWNIHLGNDTIGFFIIPKKFID